MCCVIRVCSALTLLVASLLLLISTDCYGGRSSDKFITGDSVFYDLLERNDEVMADRGFQIKEEIMLRFCSLSVPPCSLVN